ncbi:hypothetical protein GCM10027071_15010 [Microbacterium marinum]
MSVSGVRSLLAVIAAATFEVRREAGLSDEPPPARNALRPVEVASLEREPDSDDVATGDRRNFRCREESVEHEARLATPPAAAGRVVGMW